MRNDFVNGKGKAGRKSEIIDSLRLIKFSLSKWINLVMMVFFFLLGLVFEILESTGVKISGDTYFLQIGMVFLFCTAMFVPQMVVSVGVSSYVQTSARKKGLQTAIPAKLLLVSTLSIFTLILVIRLVGIVCIQGRPISELNVLPAGIFAALIILYSGFVFKFFIASVILLYISMMLTGGFYGFMEGTGQQVEIMSFGQINPITGILIAYALIVVAVGLEYLISLALHRFPLSKFAFRCSRGMNG